MSYVPTNRIGALSELAACAWLLKQGYEVFRNVASIGMIDIIAIGHGELLKLDIKTVSEANRFNRPLLKQEQIDFGVVPLYVMPNGECDIDRHPAGSFVPGEATCIGCFKPFIRNKPHGLYCSKECRGLSYKRRRFESVSARWNALTLQRAAVIADGLNRDRVRVR